MTRRSRRADADGDAAGERVALAVEPVFIRQRQTLQTWLSDPFHLHHALLLTGLPGIGKRPAAMAMARALLCETPAGQRAAPELACGHCDSCQWVMQGGHPDLRLVGLLTRDDGKIASEIGIDQIRELESFVGMTAFRGGRRVIVIDPADRLNVASANALLKMLEEPGAQTTFVLVCDREQALPATVRSRCRRLILPAPEPAEALDWLVGQTALAPAAAADLLAACGGAPLQARNLADAAHLAAHRGLLEAIASLPDTATVVAADRVGPALPVDWYPVLQRWVADLLRVCGGGQARFYPAWSSRLAELAGRATLHDLAAVAALLQSRAALTRHPLNARLFLEESLGLYRDVVDNRRAR